MKLHPILFQGPMVRALLAGTKTQTRRVVKMPDAYEWSFDKLCKPIEGFARQHIGRFGALFKAPEYRWISPDHPFHGFSPCPYGQLGDRLRVKEAAWMWCERRPNGKTKTGRDKWIYVPMREAPIHYAADHPSKPAVSVVSPDTGNAWGWRLKIGRFLPAWASRITLEITGVRVQRLQDISEADAIAEGIERGQGFPGWYRGPLPGDGAGLEQAGRDFKIPTAFPKLAYRALWDSINGPGSWDANPWVWVVEFKVVQPSPNT